MGSAAHMAYLLSWECVFRQEMGTALLKSLALDKSTPRAMLDIGCGVGDWTLEVACQYPILTITGIDRCGDAIAHARAQALIRGADNVTFTVRDASRFLGFADQTFDVVTSRLYLGSLSLDNWQPLLRECARVTRPGGIICLTGCERGSSSSPALEELTALAVLALKLAGYSGSPDGRMIGIAPLLGRFLREIGCCDIRTYLYPLDYSQGTPLCEAMREYLEAGWPLLEPALLNLGLALPEALRTLHHQAQKELRAADFCGLWPWLAVWGITPQAAVAHEEEERLGGREEADATS
jgi:ubiquinone/menaquinone biosynthesis C-methylase UbiE